MWLLFLTTVMCSAAERPVWAPTHNPSGADPAIRSRGMNFEIDQDTVLIDGLKYRRFRTGRGAIVVPDAWKLSESDFEKAFCASRAESNSNRELPMVKAEAELDSEIELKVFAELIQKTIREKCQGGESNPVQFHPNLDLGVSFRPKSKSSAIKKYKVFNRGLGPNLFFGADL